MIAPVHQNKLEWIRNGYADADQSEQTAAVRMLLAEHNEMLNALRVYIDSEKGSTAKAEAFARLKIIAGR